MVVKRLFALLLLLTGLSLGCKPTYSGVGVDQDPDAVARGAALYADQCAVCHGSAGQGANSLALTGWASGQRTLDELLPRVAGVMPKGSPQRCQGDCPRQVAAYILSGFAKGALRCEGAATYAPRRLRLLTRAEYRNTVRDLLGLGGCAPARFTYDSKGRTLRSVHVAGSFNGWPGTVAAGGWPLQAEGGLWALSRAVPDGTYQYKLVLDEKEWIADPQNPNQAPDGFGGQNSVLTVRCGGGGPALDLAALTAGFPAETRPEGFPFDNHGAARVVTPTHIEEYRAAAQKLAQAVQQSPRAIVPCDGAADRAGCTEQFLRAFGLRAFRRPLSDAELARYRALLQGQADFNAGVGLVVQAMLLSPAFLYRSEMGEPEGDHFHLSGYEVASALSYTLWGTLPDTALFEAAARGELATQEGVLTQARRLLADARSRDAVAAFALQWLGVDAVTRADKNGGQFPAWDAALAAALAEETRRFVGHAVFEGSGAFGELFTADYSFLNEALGRLYGVADARGADLQRRSLAGAAGGTRAGLLGHGSVLASHAHSNQTSPVRRGLFVRRRLLCEELPPPPPNAGAVPDVNGTGTTRERFAQHEASAFCNSCHRLIDPIGLGFERFDAIGRYRDTENGKPVDPSGDLSDVEVLGSGTRLPFATLPELGRALAGSQRAQGCFVRQVYRQAHGREDSAADLCALRQLEERFQGSQLSVRELLLELTQTPDFTQRRAPLAGE